MSRNKKYIEQFDRNAGKPSDFDSLFDFEKDELITKRRIKMKSSRSYIAAMCSAAAVIGIAAFAALAYINEKGIVSDSIISKSQGVTPSSEFSEYIEENAITLSSLVGHFDYTVSGDISGNIMQTERTLISQETEDESSFQAVVRFKVFSKSYYNIQQGIVMYQIKPLEYYVYEPYEDYLKGQSQLNLFFPAYSDGQELQIGGEYIMPLKQMGEDFSIDAFNDITTESMGMEYFARMTEKGWLICNPKNVNTPLFNALSADTENVFDDISGTDAYSLEPSDEKMMEKLSEYFESVTDKNYYHGIAEDSDSDSRSENYHLSSILPKARFEKISYAVDSNGEIDKTLLVLDNENYFSFMPYLSGYVVFAGENERGELCAALEISFNGEPARDTYANTVLISGFENLNVVTGYEIDEGTIIGECSEKPIYMQFIDNNGVPMEIELEENAYETTVVSVAE